MSVIRSGYWPVAPSPARRLAPVPRALLVGEILLDYARARRLLHNADLTTAIERLRAPVLPARGAPVEHSPVQLATAVRLGRATTLTLSRLPTDGRCLIRSLVVSSLLARRGIPAKLVLGVRPDSSQPFLAHAWVEHDGSPVLPDEGYARLHVL